MKKIFLILVLAASSTIYAQDALIGKWIRTMETPRGEKSAEMIISMQDSKIMAKTSKREFEIRQKGDSLFWDQTISTLIGKIKVSNIGVLEEDKMSGVMIMNSGPKKGKCIPWTAVRKPD